MPLQPKPESVAPEPPKPPEDLFTGLTMDQWRSDRSNVEWAQQDKRFKMMLSVVLNEAHILFKLNNGCSEGRSYGRVEGYHLALDMFRNLGIPAPLSIEEPEPDFTKQ